MRTPSSPLLRVSGLCKSYHGVSVVNGVSFDIVEGEILAMIGPNGAGKTTCFNMLHGQIPADAGEVSFFGHALIGKSPAEIWRMGLGRTFQIPLLFNSMTVIENIQMSLISYYHANKNAQNAQSISHWRPATTLYLDEALQLLTQVGMANHAQEPCHTLSYGDIKRVELAMALSNRPKLILMDEPTAGMAEKERDNIMTLIAQLVKDHRLSVLLTEHSLRSIFTYAHRIIVLAQGALIAQGSALEIRHNARVAEVYFGSANIG